LEAPPESFELQKEVAALTGCERALLGTSTLHLFWDLFRILSETDSSIFRDEGSYPIAGWGTETAAARGGPVVACRHHDAHALHELLKRPFGRRRPVVVVDGFCPACGRPAPIAEYLDCVRPLGGVVIIDDTQALGIFGHSPGVQMPYGKGGG